MLAKIGWDLPPLLSRQGEKRAAGWPPEEERP